MGRYLLTLQPQYCVNAKLTERGAEAANARQARIGNPGRFRQGSTFMGTFEEFLETFGGDQPGEGSLFEEDSIEYGEPEFPHLRLGGAGAIVG